MKKIPFVLSVYRGPIAGALLFLLQDSYAKYDTKNFVGILALASGLLAIWLMER